MLDCVCELNKAGAAGFDDKMLETARSSLKRLYIIWADYDEPKGDPGGPHWAPKFRQLKSKMGLATWTPPARDEKSMPSTPAETKPTTQP